MIYAKNISEAWRKVGPLGFVLVGAFLLTVILIIPGGKTQAAETVLRDTFRVPANANFTNISRPQSYRPGMVVEGTVQFSHETFAAYKFAARDTSFWTPLRLSRNKTAISYTDSSPLQSWQEIDRSIPKSAQWDHVLQKPIYYDELGRASADSGLVLCFVVREKTVQANKDKPTLQAKDFEVASCKDTPIQPRPSALFLGILNDKNNTLYMKVRHAGFWTE